MNLDLFRKAVYAIGIKLKLEGVVDQRMEKKNCISVVLESRDEEVEDTIKACCCGF